MDSIKLVLPRFVGRYPSKDFLECDCRSSFVFALGLLEVSQKNRRVGNQLARWIRGLSTNRQAMDVQFAMAWLERLSIGASVLV